MAAQRTDAPSHKPAAETRTAVARLFTWVEDIVYVGLGALLAVGALLLLGYAALTFSRDVTHVMLPSAIISLLDRLLLVLMIVELLYTVQVSFREHTIAPEPFLVVGLVAAIRRVLVLTAEVTGGGQPPAEAAFRVAMIELGLLTLMIVALVASLLMLRSRLPHAVATRETSHSPESS
jgi:uncharacterized membrane protein (DUF373 family)